MLSGVPDLLGASDYVDDFAALIDHPVLLEGWRLCGGGLRFPATRLLFDQVSVADGGMSHELLAVTVKLSDARLLAAVRAAVESGLLASTGDGYSFAHALIRQVVYAQILPSKRALLHRRLAEVLADRPDSVSDEIWDEAARHYSDSQLGAIVLAIASINTWNRLNAATRQITGDWVDQWIPGTADAAHAA